MQASLPMYDWPEVQMANDTLWKEIATCLPATTGAQQLALEHDPALAFNWTDPDLVFSQTCGYPLMQRLLDSVTVLGVPEYQVEGCAGVTHSSMIVVRRDDSRRSLAEFQHGCSAINSADSQSGCLALKETLALQQLPAPFFSATVVSGAHRRSLQLVAAGTADICAIDPVSWSLACHCDAETVAQLRILDAGPQTPGLPFITAAATDAETVDAMQTAMATLFNGTSPAAESALCGAGMPIIRFHKMTIDDFQPIMDFAKMAVTAGHGVLAPAA